MRLFLQYPFGIYKMFFFRMHCLTAIFIYAIMKTMRSKTDEKQRMIFDMIRNAAAMRRQTKSSLELRFPHGQSRRSAPHRLNCKDRNTKK